jgi:hypothetical protein
MHARSNNQAKELSLIARQPPTKKKLIQLVKTKLSGKYKTSYMMLWSLYFFTCAIEIVVLLSMCIKMPNHIHGC